MKNSILIFLLAISVSAAYAQDSLATDRKQHLLGIHAGVSTGVGVSYKYIVNNFGIQLTGIPIFNNENVWTSAGGALSYRFKTDYINEEPLSFLVYAGLHHLYSKEAAGSVELISGEIVESTVEKEHYNSGVGFGLEYTTEDTFMINVMAGYGLILDGATRTTLAVEIGIHYKL
jgi:hypothetical protein